MASAKLAKRMVSSSRKCNDTVVPQRPLAGVARNADVNGYQQHDYGADFDGKHDWIFDKFGRVQLRERRPNSRSDQFALE